MDNQDTLPLLELHHALEQVGAYDKIRKEKHKVVLQAYLTTDLPMGDLRDLAEVRTPQDVGVIIHRGLHKIFSCLPEAVQEEYGSPKAAIRRKSATLSPISRQRHKESITKRRGTNVGGRPKGRIDSRPRAKRSDAGKPRGQRKPRFLRDQ